MATPAVQAASCAGAATVVITTTVIVVPTADAEPAYQPFSTAPTNDNNKIIKDFWPFLVDTNATESSNKNNKDWWEWSFKRLQAADKKTLDDAFKNNALKKGFGSFTGQGSQTAATLNELCHYLIKNKETTEITTTSPNGSLAKNIWKYCSSLDNAPAKLSEQEVKKYNGKIGASKKTEVISLSWNDKFWALKNIWMKNSNITSKPSDTFFNQYKTGDKTLKEACEIAYGSPATSTGSSTTSNPTSEQTAKFCAFKIHTS